MLKLETASKLKLAGLEWERQVGDWFYYFPYGINSDDKFNKPELNLLDCELSIEEKENPCKVWANDKSIYVPRLDQLLAEIEKRMYQWELTSYSALPPVLDEEGYPRTYKIQLFDEEGQVYEIGDMANIFNPGESAAQALLWILEQEAIA